MESLGGEADVQAQRGGLKAASMVLLGPADRWYLPLLSSAGWVEEGKRWKMEKRTERRMKWGK